MVQNFIMTTPEQLEELILKSIKTALLQHKPLETAISIKHILNANEAARFLQISKHTLYRMTSNNEVPFFKRGKKLYFKRSELLKWIEAGKQKTVEEVLADTDDYLMNRKKKKQ
ncbi:MAG: helix-turn-helix domain-containing protein [Chitinophagales bacterium]